MQSTLNPEASRKDRPGTRIDLTSKSEPFALEPGSMQTEFDAPDPSEERGYPCSRRQRWCRHAVLGERLRGTSYELRC